MTLKELHAVSVCSICVTAYDADGPLHPITDYMRGSSGFMSLEITRLHVHPNGVDLVAEIDISPAVLRVLDKESDNYYDTVKKAKEEEQYLYEHGFPILK